MTHEELDILWGQALQQSVKDGEMYIRYHFAGLIEDKKKADIETLYALYKQASDQRDMSMAYQMELVLQLREANNVIFKSCINVSHWKRTAMRYLKRNAPQLHQQAVNDFNEHPDGRGKRDT